MVDRKELIKSILTITVVLSSTVNGIFVLLGTMADGLVISRSIPMGIISWLLLVIIAVWGTVQCKPHSNGK